MLIWEFALFLEKIISSKRSLSNWRLLIYPCGGAFYIDTYSCRVSIREPAILDTSSAQ